MTTEVPSEDEIRESIGAWFTSRAFRVIRVSENGAEERADMLIFDDSVRVLLELKIKGETS